MSAKIIPFEKRYPSNTTKEYKTSNHAPIAIFSWPNAFFYKIRMHSHVQVINDLGP